MKTFMKFVGAAVALLLVAVGAASMWFWFTPVGVNNYVNKITLQLAMDSPEILSSLGFIDNTPLDFHSGKLADYTKAQEEESLAKLRKAREGLDRYGPDGLEGQELLTWKITAWFLDDLIRQAAFEHGGYRVNQISGVTVNMPQFLTDTHVIKHRKSVERYLSRVAEFGRVLRETRERVMDDRDHGVIPPDFVIEKALTGMRNFIEGGAAANPLVTTLGPKLDKLDDLAAEDRARYLAEAERLVDTEVIPGYRAMIALFEEMLPGASHDAGIWRIPEGEAIYEAALRSNTTTDYTADEIHDIGLAEVARIEAEMLAILDAQGITDGDLATRVRILMEDPAQ
ncbi:MAG: DUF885 domain-containing protein, partial [Steroidobacteraceae bacterium]